MNFGGEKCTFKEFMEDLKQNIGEAVLFLQASFSQPHPKIGVVLGSGLGAFGDRLDKRTVVKTSSIPHWPISTVEGHKGLLISGLIKSVPLLVAQGRVHFYEGYGIDRVVFPIRVLARLGIKTLILTNAAGGINPTFHPDDLMVITDHINLMGTNPLIGMENPEFGPRFPDMSSPYDSQYIAAAEQAGKELSIPLRKGVLAAVTGPSYETPAEIRMLEKLGADAVSMSLVPEVIAGVQMGMRMLGISCITNMATGLSAQKLTHRDVEKIAKRAQEKFIDLISETIVRISG